MGSTAETRSPLRCVPVSLRSAVFRSPSALLCSGLLTGTPLCSGLRSAVFRSPLRSAVFRSPDRNSAVFRSPDRNTHHDPQVSAVSHGRPPVGTAARWPSGHPRPAPSRSQSRETSGRHGGAVAQRAPQTCAERSFVATGGLRPPGPPNVSTAQHLKDPCRATAHTGNQGCRSRRPGEGRSGRRNAGRGRGRGTNRRATRALSGRTDR